MPRTGLRELFFAALPELPEAARWHWWHELDALYGSPERAYHNWQHIGDMLAMVESFADALPAIAELRWAVLFHDAIYDPMGTENEVSSWQLAEQALVDVPGDCDLRPSVIRECILATRHQLGDPLSEAARWMVDFDLAILGSDRYAEYAAAIRQEYARLSDQSYAIGRRRVLRAFLQRPFVFQTEAFREFYEVRARAQIAEEIRRWS